MSAPLRKSFAPARTVTFRTGGTTSTFDQNETDYNTIGTVTAQLNSKMRLKGTVNLQSMKDLPGPTGSAGAFPTIEPDGTSTSNPTLFPSPIYLDTFDNFYVGVAGLGDELRSCSPTSPSAPTTTARTAAARVKRFATPSARRTSRARASTFPRSRIHCGSSAAMPTCRRAASPSTTTSSVTP